MIRKKTTINQTHINNRLYSATYVPPKGPCFRERLDFHQYVFFPASCNARAPARAGRSNGWDGLS